MDPSKAASKTIHELHELTRKSCVLILPTSNLLHLTFARRDPGVASHFYTPSLCITVGPEEVQ